MTDRAPTHLVLCEGHDDQRVMEKLATHVGCSQQLQFRSYAESGTLKSYLRTLAKSAEFTTGAVTSLLITCDADDHYETSWQSVRDAVRDVFDTSLENPGEWKSIPDGPKLAAWIIPEPGQPGMIETLCLDAARDQDPQIFSCINRFDECISEARQTPLHEKSRFYIWSILAQGPGPKDRLSMSRALDRLPPNWDSPVFKKLREILAEVANAET